MTHGAVSHEKCFKYADIFTYVWKFLRKIHKFLLTNKFVFIIALFRSFTTFEFFWSLLGIDLACF